jgi:hypothetical protein
MGGRPRKVAIVTTICSRADSSSQSCALNYNLSTVVQTGSYLGEDDIIRIEDDYKRT